MLPQIRHIIVNMFSSILIVTVNTSKNGGCLGFKGQMKVISFQKHKKKIIKKKYCRNHKLSYYVRQTIKNKLVFLRFWWPLVTKYRMFSDRFEFSAHKLCKNKWIKKYTLKSRAKFHVYIWENQIK